jgi:hypothetical protein
VDIGNQQRVIIVESEPVQETPTIEPARLVEAESGEKVGVEPAGAWPLPLDLDRAPIG